MKKSFLTVLIALAALTLNAQGARGVKIAYLDMNYILDKVPDYADAKNQLEQKASKWRQELEVKRNDINKLKESLQQEKPLLTKELIEEREEEIAFQEKELLDYQEKRFGPTGDLITQKSVLVKPIQDQVFTVAQDLAALRNYDFVFDKSSDLTMLFAAKKHDISDLIIKRLSRASKQERLSTKELKEFEKNEAKEELESNPDYAERQKVLEDRKNAREKKIEERKALQAEKKRAYEEKRAQMQAERDAKRAGLSAPPATSSDKEEDATEATPKSNTAATDRDAAAEANKAKQSAAASDRQAAAQAAKKEREKKIEERKKLIEEKKQKALEQKEAARKAREEKLNKDKPEASEEPATEEEAPAE